ncbi:hypothetical protein F4604DRAFT_1683500 [Suillus subluteus]|nr:hypothetical protein F4604DRAFT_1683500 [Suillus subluteus]
MHPNISHFIHRHIPSPDAEAAIKVVDSIRVTSLNIVVSRVVTHTIWNVYADSLPNLMLKDYFEWTTLIHNLHFASEDYGTGLRTHPWTTGHKPPTTPEGVSPGVEEELLGEDEPAGEEAGANTKCPQCEDLRSGTCHAERLKSRTAVAIILNEVMRPL